jgi:hypothetical protein
MTRQMAHRIPPCGGCCATCRPRRDRLLAALILLVFVLVFLLRVLVPS